MELEQQLNKSNRKRKFKRVYKVGIMVLLVLLILWLVGSLYQRQALKADEEQFPPVGQLIEIDGKNMHVYAQGEGDVTIVMTSGHGTESPYVDFYPLHEELSQHTRVVVVDRFGYGWSDETTTPRDIDTIAQELHDVLSLSGEKGPYLFVGHSISSLETIRFAQLYQNEVAGIVLLDAGNPEFYQTFNTPSKAAQKLMQGLKKNGLLRALSHVNTVSTALLAPEEGYGHELPEDLKELQMAMLLRNFSNDTIIDEMVWLQTNAKKVVENGDLGGLPLVWFTSGVNQEVIEGWTESQVELTKWSTNARQIVLEDTGHYVHHHEPGKIIQEILYVIDFIS